MVGDSVSDIKAARDAGIEDRSKPEKDKKDEPAKKNPASTGEAGF